MRNAIQASKVKARPVSWLWRKRIPKGKITILGGRPDQGKGLLAAHVAADVSRMKKNVLYSPMEDDLQEDVRPRLEAAKANLDRILLWRFMLPAQMQQMVDQIRANKIELVVIDPLAAHLSGGASRGNDSIRRLSNPMSEFAEETGVAFLIVEHVIKRPQRHAHPLSALQGGGSGMVSAARAAFLFGTDPKDEAFRVLAPVKLNVGAKPLALSFETDVVDTEEVGEIPILLPKEEIEGFDANSLLHANKDAAPGRPPDKRQAASEWLSAYLFEKKRPVRAKLIREDAKPFGITKKTLDNAAKDMKVVKEPEGGGTNCTWKLHPEVRKAMRLAKKKEEEGK